MSSTHGHEHGADGHSHATGIRGFLSGLLAPHSHDAVVVGALGIMLGHALPRLGDMLIRTIAAPVAARSTHL